MLSEELVSEFVGHEHQLPINSSQAGAGRICSRQGGRAVWRDGLGTILAGRGLQGSLRVRSRFSIVRFHLKQKIPIWLAVLIATEKNAKSVSEASSKLGICLGNVSSVRDNGTKTTWLVSREGIIS
jgi:hypothetical protein